MARSNHELAIIETLFIATDPDLAHVSATLVTAVSQQDRVAKR
ncbi:MULTISPECIES: hypothetical protein [unclassified Streptomyces]|nr:MULTISPECIES: hypothetical protein [unclassified Streptomyces]